MPPVLAALIDDGSITLVAIAVLLVELVFLWLAARRRSGMRFAPYLANGLSGLCLILALRAALLDSGAGPVALWLGLGLVAHVADVVGRLRRS
ncbi:MAG: hypothetical protein Q8Q62_15510 [Mesorhizobium sp.]|nr:hypothetical protein [Mesorhizobium sp.]